MKNEAKVIFIDFHAEATSEKVAMGFYVDGRATALVGTHTHVMTADERLLSNGTAYISDVGMVGAQESVIGMKKEQGMRRIIKQMPERLEPASEGPGLFNGVVVTLDVNSGKTLEIARIKRITEPLKVEEN